MQQALLGYIFKRLCVSTSTVLSFLSVWQKKKKVYALTFGEPKMKGSLFLVAVAVCGKWLHVQCFNIMQVQSRLLDAKRMPV